MIETATVLQSQEAEDRAATLRNRARLGANKNLLFWYRELYRDQFRDLPSPSRLSILEIGSGTSPLKQFLSNVITSDVLDLDYLDLVFDCHEIDKLGAIKDNSIDVITLTNVLHHLKNPIAFLNRAASKLKSGGKVVATEPFFSVLSTPIFKYLHHEPVDIRISEPDLAHCPTWLRVESRASCRSRIFFIDHYFILISRSAAVFQPCAPRSLL